MAGSLGLDMGGWWVMERMTQGVRDAIGDELIPFTLGGWHLVVPVAEADVVPMGDGEWAVAARYHKTH